MTDRTDLQLRRRSLKFAIARAMMSAFALGIAVCMIVWSVRRADWVRLSVWLLMLVIFGVQAAMSVREIRRLGEE